MMMMLEACTAGTITITVLRVCKRRAGDSKSGHRNHQ
jgi:hypothetical protein